MDVDGEAAGEETGTGAAEDDALELRARLRLLLAEVRLELLAGGEGSERASVLGLCADAVRDWQQLLQQPGRSDTLSSVSGTVTSLLRCEQTTELHG